jgi:hypothetical protein
MKKLIILALLTLLSCSTENEFDIYEIPDFDHRFFKGDLKAKQIDSLYELYDNDYFLGMKIISTVNNQSVFNEIMKEKQEKVYSGTFSLAGFALKKIFDEQMNSGDKGLVKDLLKSIELDTFDLNIWARYGLSRIYKVQCESREERDILLQAWDNDPNNPLINGSLCEHYINHSNLGEAEYYLEQMPKNGYRIIRLKGLLAENRNEIEKAHKYFKASYSRKKTDDNANSYFSFLLKNKFFDELEDSLYSNKNRFNYNYRYNYFLSMLSLHKKDTITALKAIKKAFEINKYDAKVEIAYIDLLLMLDRIEEAYEVSTYSRASGYIPYAYYILLRDLLQKKNLGFSYDVYNDLYINSDSYNIKKYDENGKFLYSLLTSFGIDKTRFNKMLEKPGSKSTN